MLNDLYEVDAYGTVRLAHKDEENVRSSGKKVLKYQAVRTRIHLIPHLQIIRKPYYTQAQIEKMLIEEAKKGESSKQVKKEPGSRQRKRKISSANDDTRIGEEDEFRLDGPNTLGNKQPPPPLVPATTTKTLRKRARKTATKKTPAKNSARTAPSVPSTSTVKQEEKEENTRDRAPSPSPSFSRPSTPFGTEPLGPARDAHYQVRTTEVSESTPAARMTEDVIESTVTGVATTETNENARKDMIHPNSNASEPESQTKIPSGSMHDDSNEE